MLIADIMISGLALIGIDKKWTKVPLLNKLILDVSTRLLQLFEYFLDNF
jgi:hypothetical protein